MSKLSRIFAIASLALTLFAPAFAQKVTLQEAAFAADRFFQAQSKSLVRCAKVEAAGSDTLLYIFNADNGYVVVSGDKRVPPVLAFSDCALYSDSELIAPEKMWLDSYKAQLLELKQNAGFQDVATNSAWQKLQNRAPVFRSEGEVEPFVTSKWGQEEKYNYYCPVDFAGYGGHVVTGCVATAMAQIMYYFRWPETGTGSYSYIDENYGEQSADYGSTTYDYSAMCDAPTGVNLAISKLIYHCGVGVDMVYGVSGSGMYNHSAARVMRDFFKYSPETQYVFRDSTTMDWDSLMLAHLDRRIPLYYAGWSVPNINGHAFVCDGYRLQDTTYYYHFNFGWDGSRDGYYYTGHLYVGSSNFNLAQELIVSAYPDTTNYEYPVNQPLTGCEVLTSLDGSFFAGRNNGNGYAPNMDYTWTVSPDAEDIIRVAVSGCVSIEAGDTLFITAEGSAPVAYTLTDTARTLTFSAQAPIVFRFVSDSEQQNPASNLFFNYSSVLPTYCGTTFYSTASSGSIADGSGDGDYLPLTYCKFKIKAMGYPHVNLHVNYLDLEEDRDFLYVFDRQVSSDRLLLTLTGTMQDTTIFVCQRELVFVFTSDEQGQGAGFDIDYSGITGINEAGEGSVSVYPNPVSDRLHISSDGQIRNVEVCDLAGRVLRKFAVGKSHFEAPVAGLAEGLYLVKVLSDKGDFVRKISVIKR